MRARVAALLGATVLLTTLGWTGETWAQTKVARVGVLATDKNYEACRRALAERGWIEGKNVAFEYRSTRGSPRQLSERADELVRFNVDVIYASNAAATRAAYAATRSIPNVALDYTNDPVAAGYAKSYNSPGGNLTGLFLDAPEFAGKWLDLLKSVTPDLSRVGVLWDPTPGTTHLIAIQGAARSRGIQLQVLEVRTPQDFDATFSAVQARTQALIILPSPMTLDRKPPTCRTRDEEPATRDIDGGPIRPSGRHAVLRARSGLGPA